LKIQKRESQGLIILTWCPSADKWVIVGQVAHKGVAILFSFCGFSQFKIG